MSKRYYLAGPMSGVPQCNFPMFKRVAHALRIQEFDIVSPAELDDAADAAAALASEDGSTSAKRWVEFLARDVRIVGAEVNGIIFLPDWERSRGARLEATVGLLRQDAFQFMRWDDESQTVYPMARTTVACMVHREMLS